MLVFHAPIVSIARTTGKRPHVQFTLTPDEIWELTGYRRGAEQLRELLKRGIYAWRRPDGTICVPRTWAERPPGASEKERPRVKPI